MFNNLPRSSLSWCLMEWILDKILGLPPLDPSMSLWETEMTMASNTEIAIYTFGRLGKMVPPRAHYVIDVSGIRDPLSNRGFKNTFTDGRPGEIQKFVAEDPRMNAILDTVKLIAYDQLRSKAGSKKWLSIAFRDHHGKWGSVAVGEIVRDALKYDGYNVALRHYELEGVPK